MKKYFLLEYKRASKIIPIVLIISLVLFSGILVIMSNFISTQVEEKKPYKIAITGDTDDKYFEIGLGAISTIDSSRFTLELVIMEEDEAIKLLEKNEISGYAVFPENFIHNAIHGEIDTIKFVTTTSSTGIATIFKNELTKVITDFIVESQKGVYGISDALSENGHDDISHKEMNRLNIEYVSMILNRSKMYDVSTLGISRGMSFIQYYLGSFVIIFLMFMVIPYGTVYVKKDYSINKILSAKKCGALKQTLSEYFSFSLSLAEISAIITVILAIIKLKVKDADTVFANMSILDFALCLIPMILVTCALSLLIFEISDNLISGLLLQFFLSFFLCYVSGCIFPIYSMPKILQVISNYLPTGACRNLFEAAFLGESPVPSLILISGLILLFLTATVAIKKHKILHNQG